MSKIDPDYINGDCVCSGSNCPSYKKIVVGLHFTAYQCEQLGRRVEMFPGNICIPGIKAEVERLRSELEAAKEELEKLKDKLEQAVAIIEEKKGGVE